MSICFNPLTCEVYGNNPNSGPLKEGYKICFTCKNQKPFSEFYSNKAKTNGLYGSCISCFKAKAKYPKSSDLSVLYKECFLEIEEWRPIIIGGIEYPYSISDSGRVIIKKGGKIAAPSFDQRGYPQIVLTANKKRSGRRIHILVAEAFIGNPENLPEVNHLNGNKLFPHKSNLEYSTSKNNVDHATGLGLRKAFTSSNHPNCIPVFNRKTFMLYPSAIAAAIDIGISAEMFRRKLSGKIKNDTDFIYLK